MLFTVNPVKQTSFGIDSCGLCLLCLWPETANGIVGILWALTLHYKIKWDGEV